MRHTVLVHDLGATELQVGRVDLATKQLVDGWRTRQDDRLAFDLDRTLAQAHQICADTDGAARHQRDGEDVLVSARGGTGNQAGTSQAFDAEAVLGSDDGRDLVPLLTILLDELGDDFLLLALIQPLLDLGSEIQVLEPFLGLLRIVPCHVQVRDQLIRHSDACTGVSRQIDAWDTQLASELSALVEELVLLRAKRSNLVGDIVGDDNEPTSVRVFRCEGRDDPADHTVGVGAGLAGHLNQIVLVVQYQLVVLDAFTHGWPLFCQRRDLLDRLVPAVLERLTEEVGEIVHVLRAHHVRLVPLRLQPLLGRVRRRHGPHMHRADVVRTANAVEHPFTFLGLLLNVQLDLDDETVRVGDNHPQWVR